MTRHRVRAEARLYSIRSRRRLFWNGSITVDSSDRLQNRNEISRMLNCRADVRFLPVVGRNSVELPPLRFRGRRTSAPSEFVMHRSNRAAIFRSTSFDRVFNRPFLLLPSFAQVVRRNWKTHLPASPEQENCLGRDLRRGTPRDTIILQEELQFGNKTLRPSIKVTSSFDGRLVDRGATAMFHCGESHRRQQWRDGCHRRRLPPPPPPPLSSSSSSSFGVVFTGTREERRGEKRRRRKGGKKSATGGTINSYAKHVRADTHTADERRDGTRVLHVLHPVYRIFGCQSRRARI